MKTLTLSLRLGATADIPIRVESDELTFAPITAMTKSAPVAITSTGHGIPDGWRAAASRMAPSDRRSCWPSATI